MIAQSRVIAKGRRIRDLPRLAEKYGGTPSKWTKKSSPVFESDSDLIGMNIMALEDSKSSERK